MFAKDSFIFFIFILLSKFEVILLISVRDETFHGFDVECLVTLMEKIFMAFAITLSFDSLLLKYAFTVLQKVLSLTFLALKFSWRSFFIFRKRFTQ